MAPPQSFSQDILTSLTGLKKVEMLQLMHRFNSGQMQIQEFIGHVRQLLGQRLYAQLSAALNDISARQRTAVSMDVLARMTPQEMLGPGLRALEHALHDGDAPLMANATPAGTLQHSQSAPVIGATSSEPSESAKVDTDLLQDILQYSGVDLKAESDAIMRDQDFLLSQVAHSSGADPYARANLLFNVDLLRTVIANVAVRHQLGNVKQLDSSIMELLLYGLQARMSAILDELVHISRVRVDVLRARFKMKIENDARRQLFVLDKALAHRNERYLAKAGGVGSGTLMGPSPIGVAAGPVDTVDASSQQGPGLGSASEDMDLGLATAKRTRMAGPSSELEALPPGLAPEGLAAEQHVRSRLTNATALTQLGVPVKSWMLGGAGAIGSTGPSAPSGSKDGTPLGSPSVVQTPTLKGTTSFVFGRSASAMSSMLPQAGMSSGIPSAASLLNVNAPIVYGISDKEWRASVLERKCSLVDLVFFLSYDPELARSNIYTKALASLRN